HRDPGANPGRAHRKRSTHPEVIGAMPHKLHRLAHFLRDLRGLDRSVHKHHASEPAAAFDDVHGDLIDPKTQRGGDLFLRQYRGLNTSPYLGLVPLYIGYAVLSSNSARTLPFARKFF